MNGLILRYLSLASFIGIILYHSIKSKEASVTIIFFLLTIVLCLYFLIPIMKNPLLNYILIVIILPISAIASINFMYILPLFAFFVLESTFHLTKKQLIILLCLVNSISLLMFILSTIPIYGLLLIGIVTVSTSLLNSFVEGQQEKGKLYEVLLSEYRLLKRMSVEQEQLARSEERTKIARDMHDSVGHKLTALLMQLEVLTLQNEQDELEDVKRLARESLEETRYAVRQLKLNEASGIESVIQLIRKLEMESRLHIRFTLEKGVLSLPISNHQSIVLYRVLQEALTNAMKYSESKEVEVIIGVNSLQQVQFAVKNKYRSTSPFIRGFGLSNMEDRLKEIGGELRIVRTDQQFTVEGLFPIN